MTIISSSKFLDFKSAKSPQGHDWYYVKRNNDSSEHDSAVVITTLVKNKQTDEYDFLLMKTKRPPLYAEKKSDFCIESPAGLIGDINENETLEECAKKELLEEAGLSANKIFIEMKNCSTSSGLSSETLSFVTAIVNEYNVISQPVSDGGIIVERFFVPAKNIRQYLFDINNKENSVATATVCGIYFALARI